MRIVANHAHLMPEPVAGSWWPAGNAEMLLKHLDYCGIEKTVVFPPFASQMDNSIRKANQWAWDQVGKHADRLIAAGCIFPLAPDAIELLQMFADAGVHLAKVHPSINPHDIADPAARRFYARAEELGIALDYHTGPHGTRLSLAKPEKFDDLAWDHPRLKLVFEHLGGRTYFEEFMAILQNHRVGRVYGGVTSVLNAQANSLWCFGPEKLRELVRNVGAQRLIFGLDFPWNTPEVNREDIRMIGSLDIPEADKEKILGGNLLQLVSG